MTRFRIWRKGGLSSLSVVFFFSFLFSCFFFFFFSCCFFSLLRIEKDLPTLRGDNLHWALHFTTSFNDPDPYLTLLGKQPLSCYSWFIQDELCGGQCAIWSGRLFNSAQSGVDARFLCIHFVIEPHTHTHTHIKQISSNWDAVSRLQRPSISAFPNISYCNSVDETGISYPSGRGRQSFNVEHFVFTCWTSAPKRDYWGLGASELTDRFACLVQGVSLSVAIKCWFGDFLTESEDTCSLVRRHWKCANISISRLRMVVLFKQNRSRQMYSPIRRNTRKHLCFVV